MRKRVVHPSCRNVARAGHARRMRVASRRATMIGHLRARPLVGSAGAQVRSVQLDVAVIAPDGTRRRSTLAIRMDRRTRRILGFDMS